MILFFILCALTALVAIIYFVIAAVFQSKRLFKIGLGVAIVPIFLSVFLYWVYEINTPKLNRREEKSYAEIYVMVPPIWASHLKSTNKPQLILNANNTYQLDKNDFIPFYGKGTWRAGANEDGYFEFKDDKTSNIFWAEPSNNNKLNIEISGLNTQTIVFVK